MWDRGETFGSTEHFHQVNV